MASLATLKIGRHLSADSVEVAEAATAAWEVQVEVIMEATLYGIRVAKEATRLSLLWPSNGSQRLKKVKILVPVPSTFYRP